MTSTAGEDSRTWADATWGEGACPRGDRFAEASIGVLGFGFMRPAMAGDLTQAERMLTAAMEPWRRPQRGERLRWLEKARRARRRVAACKTEWTLAARDQYDAEIARLEGDREPALQLAIRALGAQRVNTVIGRLNVCLPTLHSV